MNEKPILMSLMNIRPTMEGRKTQTRRVIKLSKGDTIGHISEGNKLLEYIICDKDGDEVPLEFVSPYGVADDRLWVREAHVLNYSDDIKVAYRADWHDGLKGMIEQPKWRPSIFMPRWASRITLEVTEVRVQRLNEISDEDAQAEGVEPCEFVDGHPAAVPGGCLCHLQDPPKSHVCTFIELWDSINGKSYPWASNPWVWALTFKRLATI